ncbi:MAG: ATP-binding protein [Blautia sp.]|nr:ATP-binding protein [Blautia sp.]
MSVRELTIEAKKENLDKVMAFLESRLEELNCTPKAQIQISVAMEEIFVNVASYAYQHLKNIKEGPGMVSIRVEDTEDPRSVAVTFEDSGIPFDPLSRQDPDVSLPAEERGIGGLGIYMVKKSMDHVHYEYKDGKNIMTFRKDL